MYKAQVQTPKSVVNTESLPGGQLYKLYSEQGGKLYSLYKGDNWNKTTWSTLVLLVSVMTKDMKHWHGSKSTIHFVLGTI